MRLIDADALIRAFNEAQVEFDEYYKGLGRAKVITDNAPTVEYTFEEAFQKTVCEQRLYCPKRPQGEWIIDGHHIRCNKCNEYICTEDREGNSIPNNFCLFCGAEMQKGGAE